MLRAVVDTNITVSGLLFGGLPLKVIHAALARRFAWVTSPALMDETERVMRSDKFGLSQREIQILISPIFEVAEIVIPVNTIQVIERCPADNRVLECAVEGKCSVIVSGDRRDLLSLKHYLHIEIITPRQFLDRI
jgi:putative PIN family toxin of toxin-antitoxin system